MGKQALIIVVALSIGFWFIGGSMHDKENRTVSNYVSYHERQNARNISGAVIQRAMRQLADSSTWRAGYSEVAMLGGKASLTVRDTTFRGQKAMKIGTLAVYGKETHSDSLIFKNAGGFVPPVVRAAFTAFGPLDKSLSDMVVDGRDHDTNNAYVPLTGKFAVSTGAPTFINLEPANLGGTDRTMNPYQDIVPAYPEDPRTVEKASLWKNGFPQTPDAGLELDEGTLMAVAKTGIAGSRYITSFNDLNKAPVRGITYLDLPAGSSSTVNLPANPEGILIIHSKAVDADVQRLTIANGAPFKGLILVDRIFHIHADILGAIVELTQNTEMLKECNGNKDHWINYSSDWIKKATSILGGPSTNKGGWRSKFVVLSWRE